MKEYGLYQGEMPQQPQQQFQGSGFAPKVDTSTWGNMLDGAIEGGIDTLITFAEIKDEEESQRVEARQREVESNRQLEYEKRQNLPWGDEKSFYDKNGNLKEDTVNEFITGWQQDVENVGGSFWLRKYGNKYQSAKQSIMDDIAGKVKLQLTRQGIQNAKTAFNDNYELAIKQGDLKGAINSIMGAVKKGIITSQRGKIMMLDINKKSIAGNANSGSLSIGDKTYLGDSAMLAAAKQKAGQLDNKPFMIGDLGTPDYLMQAVGDSRWGLSTFSDKEMGDIMDALSPVYNIKTSETETGQKNYQAGESAGKVAKAVASNASKRGEISYQDGMAMVARIAADQFFDNDNMTTEQGVALFEGSEVYAVLGQGDEERGKATVRSIMQDVRDRQRGGSKISMEEAQKYIKKHIQEKEKEIGRGNDWVNYSDWAEFAKVERIKDWVNEEGGIDKDLYKGVRHVILPIYEQYREQYLKAVKKEEEKKDRAGEELMEWAGEFAKWYHKEIGEEAKERSKALTEAAYLSKWLNYGIVEMANKGADNVLANSYGADHARLKNVLNSPIENCDGLSVSEAKKMLTDKEHIAKSFKKKAAADYEKLKANKEGVIEKKEEEKKHAKEAEKLEKAREREEETARKKRQTEAEKRQARNEKIRLSIKRREIRQTDWEWDDSDTGDADIPYCTLPQAEYERVVEELGYTGERDLYIRTRYGKVLVGGVNKGESIKFNTSATMKMQGRLKKGQSPIWNGNLEYRYEF